MSNVPFVLAFYYPWYGTPDGCGYWHHWKADGNNSPFSPTLGKYDSHDPKVIKKHIKWARQARIDGFVVAWTGANSFTDKALQKIVDIANAENFLISVYVEDAKDATDYASKLEYLKNSYTSHPCWLRTINRWGEDKPVVFIYRRVFRNDLESKIDIGFDSGFFTIGDIMMANGMEYFDGQHLYLPICDIEFLDIIYDKCGGDFFVATVAPGFDDSFIRKESQIYTRSGTALYDEMWQIAIASRANWAIVSTWNEWQEGSQIEPAKEYGKKYLWATKKWSIMFKTSR